MDQIFDRLGNLLKSTLRGTSQDDIDIDGYSDPDLQDAWDELNDFLNSDTGASSKQGPAFESRSYPKSNLPQNIVASYQILGVSPDIGMPELAKAYKGLLLKNHPDRVAGDPAKVVEATEKTKQINRAFQEIKAYRAST